MTSLFELDRERPRTWRSRALSEWRSVVEVVGLLALVAVAEWVLFRTVGAPRVHPHPYWIVVFFGSPMKEIHSGHQAT